MSCQSDWRLFLHCVSLAHSSLYHCLSSSYLNNDVKVWSEYRFGMFDGHLHFAWFCPFSRRLSASASRLLVHLSLFLGAWGKEEDVNLPLIIMFISHRWNPVLCVMQYFCYWQCSGLAAWNLFLTSLYYIHMYIINIHFLPVKYVRTKRTSLKNIFRVSDFLKSSFYK